MKIKLLCVAILGALALAGCNKGEPTVIDQEAAKKQPGADTPAATTTGAATEAAQRAEKEGK